MNTDSYYTHEPSAHGTVLRDRVLHLAAVLPIAREMIEARSMFLPHAARGRLLDIGCGNGAFLASMQARGWEVDGVEPDAAAAEVATRTIGKQVFAGTVDEAGFAEGSFTAITMSHVIEHVPDPLATLRTCLRLLEPGGALYLTTPNTLSLGRRVFGEAWLHWDPPRHLYLFNPTNLADLLERAGFAQTHIRTISRAARWAWAASTTIRSKGRLDPNRNGGLAQQVNAAAFHLREHFLAGADGGEEIFALAAKSSTQQPRDHRE